MAKLFLIYTLSSDISSEAVNEKQVTSYSITIQLFVVVFFLTLSFLNFWISYIFIKYYGIYNMLYKIVLLDNNAVKLWMPYIPWSINCKPYPTMHYVLKPQNKFIKYIWNTWSTKAAHLELLNLFEDLFWHVGGSFI